jgi:hypothetical protein
MHAFALLIFLLSFVPFASYSPSATSYARASTTTPDEDRSSDQDLRAGLDPAGLRAGLDPAG